MAFIAGAYVLETGGNFIGQIEDGINIEYSNSMEEVRGDNLGQSIQDGVYRGGNCYVDFTLLEYNMTYLHDLIWPWSDTFGMCGVPGLLATSRVTPLTFTAITGSPAHSGVHSLYTMDNAILAPEYPVRLSFNSRLRRVQLRLQLLPFVSTDTYWFKPSAYSGDPVTYTASSNFTAGPYTATFGHNAARVDLGTTEDGFDIEYIFHADPIRGDNLGDSIQDYVYRGGDCFVNCTLTEWSAARAAILAPVFGSAFHTGKLKTESGVSQMGGLVSAATYHDELILTRVASTATPTTFVANQVALAPGYPIRYVLAPRLRRIPLRFQLFPNATTPVWFAVT